MPDDTRLLFNAGEFFGRGKYPLPLPIRPEEINIHA
jgi:hypothetical protein